MDDKYRIVNSEPSLNAYIAWVKQAYEKHKYLTFSKPRIGPDRSLDQNALFHVWCTQLAAHYLNKAQKGVTKGELEGMKRTVKRECYQDNVIEGRLDEWRFLIHTVINPKNPKETKADFTSSSSWKRMEMCNVLTWLQAKVAFAGVVLESKGELKKLQDKERDE
mgnify:CR=1 FL=1